MYASHRLASSLHRYNIPLAVVALHLRHATSSRIEDEDAHLNSVSVVIADSIITTHSDLILISAHLRLCIAHEYHPSPHFHPTPYNTLLQSLSSLQPHLSRPAKDPALFM
ncbi:hypothetical protein AC578_2695 [Pseudocercospora eumusae]|uniref:Uncharacterized protein n=1 Tax=Pseudocercospora eumusae TaxID=321146 RepID=A0A139HFW2_9PEZI|nr:hypothetical protein AC578_2695 [Pseudocercospora eumusae]